MTNYNDGKWHGWNGGECPVHPKTVVEGYWRNGITTSACPSVYNTGVAGGLNFSWDGETRLHLFRVIKEHKEPREFWAAQGEMCKCGQHGWIEVDRDCAPYATLFREVQQ